MRNYKKMFLALTVLFVILTVIGAVCILLNRGTVSAGYACIPLLFALAFGGAYHKSKKETVNARFVKEYMKSVGVVVIAAIAVAAVLFLVLRLCPGFESWLHKVTGWH